jgi:hypothetical protein
MHSNKVGKMQLSSESIENRGNETRRKRQRKKKDEGCTFNSEVPLCDASPPCASA